MHTTAGADIQVEVLHTHCIFFLSDPPAGLYLWWFLSRVFCWVDTGCSMHWRPDPPCHITWPFVKQPQSHSGESFPLFIRFIREVEGKVHYLFIGLPRWLPGVETMIPMTTLNKMVSFKFSTGVITGWSLSSPYEAFVFPSVCPTFNPFTFSLLSPRPPLSFTDTTQTFYWWSFAKVRNCGSGRTPRKALERSMPSGTRQRGCPSSTTQTTHSGTRSTHALRSGTFRIRMALNVRWAQTGWWVIMLFSGSQAKEWILRDWGGRGSSSLWPQWKARKVRRKTFSSLSQWVLLLLLLLCLRLRKCI